MVSAGQFRPPTEKVRIRDPVDSDWMPARQVKLCSVSNPTIEANVPRLMTWDRPVPSIR
jgi:hypothetical protein